MYETDEHQVWLNLQTAKVSQFMKKRTSYMINQKLDELKAERDMLFNRLSKSYNERTNFRDGALQLQARTDYVKDLQNKTVGSSAKKLAALDSDLMTKSRQIQINKNIAERRRHTTNNLKVIWICTLIVLVFIILGKNGILPIDKMKGTIIIGVVFGLGIASILMKEYKEKNRSQLDYQVQHWHYGKDKKKKTETATTKPTEDSDESAVP